MKLTNMIAGKKIVSSLVALTMASMAFAISSWENSRKYTKGDEAVYNGKLWRAKWWTQGETPANGERSPWYELHENTVSAWSETMVYTVGDQVLYDGKIWETKWWTTGYAPQEMEGNPWSFVTDLEIQTTLSTEDQLTLSITDSIPDAAFNKIVTFDVSVPEGWQYVKSTQKDERQIAGTQREAHIDIEKVENGLVRVTAIPEAGPLVLVPEANGENVGFTGRVVDNGTIVADYFYNKYHYNKRPLILLGGSDGGKTWSHTEQIFPRTTHNFTEARQDLVKQGYAALSLAYFGLDGLPATLEKIPLETFEKGRDWLKNQTGIDSRNIAVMGRSKGAEMSLLLGTKYPEIKAVVAIVPASNVFEGIGEQGVSSWTWQGEQIPFAPFIDMGWPLVNSFRASLADPVVAEQSAIPVEAMKAPLFLLSGQQDKMWHSHDMSESIMERLQKNHYPYHFEHVYSETKGHDVAFHAEYWAKVMEFLKKHYPVQD